jgi:hypothetical protein
MTTRSKGIRPANWKLDPPAVENWYHASIAREEKAIRFWHGRSIRRWSHAAHPDDPPEVKELAKEQISSSMEIEWLKPYATPKDS